MIRGRIAISEVDPKRWRAKGRKRQKQPASASIVTPGPTKRGEATTRQSEPTSDHGRERRSAIVEPKRKPNSMLAHLTDDYDPEEHRLAGEKADELFREIVRRAALPENE